MMEHGRTAGWEAIVGEERFGTYSHLVRNDDPTEDGISRGRTAASHGTGSGAQDERLPGR